MAKARIGELVTVNPAQVPVLPEGTKVVIVPGSTFDPNDGFPLKEIYESCAAVIGRGTFESMMQSQIPFYKILECCILVAFDSSIADDNYLKHEDTIRKAYRHVRVHLRR